MSTLEYQLEESLIAKLVGLKYKHREDIRDRAALEHNFRQKFETLNRVKLTDGEFQRLLDEIVVADVYDAASRLRERSDDVLFINAEKEFDKGKRQNFLSEKHIERIIKTYRERPDDKIERYARRVEMSEIKSKEFNLNISRYVSTAEPEVQIDLAATHKELVEIEKAISVAKKRHNGFLAELGLEQLP